MTPRLLLVLALAACGSSSKTSPDGAPAVDAAPTPDMACATSSMERSQKLLSCSATDLQRRFGDLATCVARDTLACTEALAAPMTGNTPSDVLTCATAIDAETCADFFTKVPPSACTTQTGPETGACSFPAQCTSGFCAIPSGSLCGTCAPQPAAGDSCATIGCGQDLVCVPSSMQCQVPVAAAGTCSRDLPCADGLTCVGSTVNPPVTGTCTAEATTVGATCDPKHKTGVDCSADGGLTCDATTNQCVTEPLAAAGMPCGLMAGITTRCTAAATCVIPTGQTMGTCVAPAADNAACDTAAGPTCLTPARCIPTTAGGTAGTCKLPGSMTCP
jgi:hypothetical protein